MTPVANARKFSAVLGTVYTTSSDGAVSTLKTTYSTEKPKDDYQKKVIDEELSTKKWGLNALRPMSLSPCLMSKYILLVIFGPRAASAGCAQKMAARDTTTKMSDALAKNILSDEMKVKGMQLWARCQDLMSTYPGKGRCILATTDSPINLINALEQRPRIHQLVHLLRPMFRYLRSVPTR